MRITRKAYIDIIKIFLPIMVSKFGVSLNIKVHTYIVHFGTSWIIKSTLIRLLNGCKNGTGLS